MTHRQAIGWLLLVAFVWGCSFTFVKQALTLVSPLMFMAVRFGIATIFIAGVLRDIRGPELRAGLVLAVLFWVGFIFQTVGLEQTTASRSAFITSLSGMIVPLVTLAIYRHAPSRGIWIAIVAATGGMYLLTAPDAGGMNFGDTLTLGCAVIFSGHIVAVTHYARQFDPTRLLAVQLGGSALLSLLTAPLIETPRFEPDLTVGVILVALALTGLWSFHMQLRAQRIVSPSEAGLIYLFEPVIATGISFVVLGERFTPLQWVGSVLILSALVVPIIGDRRAERAAAGDQSRPTLAS